LTMEEKKPLPDLLKEWKKAQLYSNLDANPSTLGKKSPQTIRSRKKKERALQIQGKKMKLGKRKLLGREKRSSPTEEKKLDSKRGKEEPGQTEEKGGGRAAFLPGKKETGETLLKTQRCGGKGPKTDEAPEGQSSHERARLVRGK